MSLSQIPANKLAAARKSGWTPPKWWQWWRGNDHREPFVDMNANF